MRLRDPEAWQLAVMRARGEEEQAQKLLDALNAFPRAFGKELFDMPEPATTGLPDLVMCRADVPFTRISFDTAPDNGNPRIVA